MADMEEAPTRLRFSLWTLCAVVTVAAVFSGLIRAVGVAGMLGLICSLVVPLALPAIALGILRVFADEQPPGSSR